MNDSAGKLATAGFDLELRLLNDDLAGFRGALDEDPQVRVEIARSSWEVSRYPVALTLRIDRTGAGDGDGWFILRLETYNGIAAQYRSQDAAFPVVTIPSSLWRDLRCPHVVAAQLTGRMP
jgi:hypothetical protein